MNFSLFQNNLPLEKGGALHLNKLESPSPKDGLCQVWSKLAQWFWRRGFFKESGRIRRRFGRNVAYNKGWKIIDDSYAFSNAIRLIVFLITGKLVKFYKNVFCFFKIWFWIGQYDQFHTIIDKFYFVLEEFWCLWVLSPRIWNVIWMHLSKMNLLHQLKNWRDDPWPRDTPKIIFLFYFGVENMLSQNI